MQLLVLVIVTLADFRLICGYRNQPAEDASKLSTLCDFPKEHPRGKTGYEV